jgi:hypothetical protein
VALHHKPLYQISMLHDVQTLLHWKVATMQNPMMYLFVYLSSMMIGQTLTLLSRNLVARFCKHSIGAAVGGLVP